MEEIQTKKLNLRALQTHSHPEDKKNEDSLKEEKISQEEPQKTSHTEEVKVNKEEKSGGVAGLGGSYKKSEDVKKQVEKEDSKTEDKPMIQKLSLNMLKKEDGENEKKNTEETKQTKTLVSKDEKTHIVKVNLKGNSPSPEKTEEEKEEEKKENKTEITPSSENSSNESKRDENKDKTLSKQESDKTEDTAKQKEGGDTIEKTEEKEHTTVVSPEENHDNTAVINAIIGEDDDEKKEDDENTENEEIHFQNYESSFKEQSTKVIERLRNFRYTPKTRKGFVLSLIVLTVTMISGIMIMFPNHPINTYKANLLETYLGSPKEDKTPLAIDTNNPFPEVKKDEEDSEDIQENSNNTDSNESTSTGNISLDTSQKESNEAISEEERKINNKKKEVLRNHLLQKYYQK